MKRNLLGFTSLLCMAAETVSTASAAEPAKSKFDPSETKYFEPSRLSPDAEDYASLVTSWCEANKVQHTTNIDGDIPEGFGLLITPIQKRTKAAQGDDKGSLEVTGEIIAMVPDLSALMNNPKGLHYLRSVVNDAMGRRLKALTVAAFKEGNAPQLPKTIEGFIEAIRARSPLYTFNQLQERLRNSLDKKGVKLSKEMLMGVLMSQSFAEQLLPNVAQAQWGIVLDKAIEAANKDNLDPAILLQWKSNRATAQFAHAEAADLDDIEI